MKRVFSVTAASLLLFAAGPSLAAGFRIVEQDNAAQSMAHAVTAGVSDASAVYYNPAAMTELGAYAAKVGVQVIDPKTDFAGSGANAGFSSRSTANTSYAVPNLYMVKNLGDSGVAVGLGLFSNFGLGTTWSIEGPFRYVATDSQLSTSTVTVNVAKKLGDMLSLAVGLDYLTARGKLDSMYPFAFFEPGAADGYLNLRGTGSGFGFNAAALLRPADSVRVGLAYRSRIKTTLSGDLELQNLPGTLAPLMGAGSVAGADYKTSSSLDITFPDIVTFGVAVKVTEALSVEGGIDYTLWSTYDKQTVKNDRPLLLPNGVAVIPAEQTTRKDWKDTLAVRVGGAYALSPATTLRAGYYFDPTPVPEETFDPRMPDATRNGLCLGVGYKATDRFSVDFAYAYIWSDTRTVNNEVGANTRSSVDGDYQNKAQVYGLSFGYAM
ncbi:MAG: transporter [Nitrospinae bacterium]|nr:transporter [Nitrospinota bacterium]